ncbi:site-specific integrase [Paraburkholderia sediminicola]|uniref:site-specific integrase n=1 Tax=Paraburkholderia sediminicola TaxID=458836 RepID=UPI0038BDA937
MHNELRIPDLSFPQVEFGAKETPWNLNILLYTGGADARMNHAQKLIASGAFGDPQLDRLELITKLHDEIGAGLGTGGSRNTALAQIQVVRSLFGFADRTSRPLTLDTVTDTYCAWADSLVHRTRLKKGTPRNARYPEQIPLAISSAYALGAAIGKLLNSVLERQTSIVELTRLTSPKKRKTAVGVQAEKQSLSDAFAFGHLLQDVCDGLTLQAVLEAPLPVQLELRRGQLLIRHGDFSIPTHKFQHRVLGVRYTLANLRIEAELLMFIAQTGMNLEQGHNLQLRHFFYVSHLDGYQVKEHKARRGGKVLFEIFKDYKAHFERYLDWRRSLFPDSNRLFPFVGQEGSRPDRRFTGHRFRAVCKELGLRFGSPRLLRNTRVNWMLRTTGDPDLTAEMAQHTKQTLLGVYELPSLQRALVETTRFWSKFDPDLAKTQAVAPGGCNGNPTEVANIPAGTPRPDCTTASGCLWCENHRDVDTLDYVWALASFNQVKVIELSKTNSPQSDNDVPPCKRVIDRIHDKLRWFEQSNEVRSGWVDEAQARVAEGDFHPEWRNEISELEGTV